MKQVQIERPAYASGAPEWWGEVIRRTALGAGADPSRKCTLLLSIPYLVGLGLEPETDASRPPATHHPVPIEPVIVRSSTRVNHLGLSGPSRGSFYGCDLTSLA